MQPSFLLTSFFNWLLGLSGVLALIIALSFLPTLFGYANPEHVFMVVGGIVLSKGILGFFSYPFAIGVLVISTALFVWVCLLFSMSSHTMVESLVSYMNDERIEGVTTAWLTVFVINFFLVSLFVYILFGMILTPATLLIGGLMMAALGSLLVANYRETYRI